MMYENVMGLICDRGTITKSKETKMIDMKEDAMHNVRKV